MRFQKNNKINVLTFSKFLKMRSRQTYKVLFDKILHIPFYFEI